MIKLHYKIKCRALGITFGTVEDTKDVSALLLGLVQKIVPGFAALGSLLLSNLSEPHVLYNDRGVLIELK